MLSKSCSLASLGVCLLIGMTAPAIADGPVLLTVSGSVGEPNRGPVDPEYDKLFAFNDVSFNEAHEFDLTSLEGLPQANVRADFPLGGPETEFSGPLLADVLEAAGAEGELVTVQAMDGYAVEVPLADMVGKGAVIALERDGKPLGIGDFGPTQIVFPRAEREDLSGMSDDWWIWQIYHISVQ